MQVLSFDIGIRHLAYCILEQPGSVIRDLQLVDLGCSKRETQKIVDEVLEFLDEMYYKKIDQDLPLVVLIESQMTSVMKSIQTVINTFFKMVSKYTGHDITTKYVSSKLKLKYVSQFQGYSIPVEIQNITKPYKKNKQLSCHFGKWYISNVYLAENRDSINSYVDSLKKMDDVCDALLMTLYYVP